MWIEPKSQSSARLSTAAQTRATYRRDGRAIREVDHRAVIAVQRGRRRTARARGAFAKPAPNW
jgi:hypothetical protein